MSQEYDKPLANIFVNKDKQEGSNQPDYKGKLGMTKEVVMDLLDQIDNGSKFATLEYSAWKKTSDKAGMYLSGQIQKLYRKPDAQPMRNSANAEMNRAKPVPPQAPEVSDEEIPF